MHWPSYCVLLTLSFKLDNDLASRRKPSAMLCSFVVSVLPKCTVGLLAACYQISLIPTFHWYGGVPTWVSSFVAPLFFAPARTSSLEVVAMNIVIFEASAAPSCPGEGVE